MPTRQMDRQTARGGHLLLPWLPFLHNNPHIIAKLKEKAEQCALHNFHWQYLDLQELSVQWLLVKTASEIMSKSIFTEQQIAFVLLAFSIIWIIVELHYKLEVGCSRYSFSVKKKKL